MKTKKKQGIDSDGLDSIIGAGNATVEKNGPVVKRKRGRPKSKIDKVQSPFYLPVNIVKAIDDNCKGNKSVFAEEVFTFYFKSNKIDYGAK
jgi:hypothetical protein